MTTLVLSAIYPIPRPVLCLLFDTALPQMEAHQADLGHDAVTLDKAEPRSHWIFGVRKTGTTLMVGPATFVRQELVDFIANMYSPDQVQMHKWYMLRVTQSRLGLLYEIN